MQDNIKAQIDKETFGDASKRDIYGDYVIQLKEDLNYSIFVIYF